MNSSSSTASNENFLGVTIPPVNAGSNLTIAAEGALDSYNTIAVFAYLDFNNVGYYDYSAGSVEMKKLYSSSTYSANYTTGNQTLNIPSNTASNIYRLRIIAFAQASANTLNPCNYVSGGGVKGQAEDYQITIVGQACTAPTFTYTMPTSCSNNQFYINVNVTSLGNASSVHIKNGTTTLTTVYTTGNHLVGPFAISDSIVLILQGNTSSSCVLISESFKENTLPTKARIAIRSIYVYSPIIK